MDADSSDEYPTYTINKKGRHGVLLIINNVLFGGDGSKDCEQSVADAQQLAKVFHDCRYKISTKQDLDATEITDTVRSVVTNDVNSNDDSFICCILSHGNAQGIQGVKKPGDDKNAENFVTVTELADIVKECQQLHGKPKIFIFQACRGDKAPIPVTADDPEASTTGEAKSVVVDGRSTALPPDADFLFGFSTTEGNVATRYINYLKYGSPYIKALCTAIENHPKWSIDDILLLVNDEVSRESLALIPDEKYQQMPEIGSTLCKKFYITK